MVTSRLRKVGGSVVLTIPPAILETARLRPGTAVRIAVESGRMVIEPEVGKRYSLRELLAQCAGAAPLSGEDAQWTASASKGQELI